MAGELQRQVFEFADLMADGADEIHKQSAADYAADASRPISEGGRMPIDTGALQDSINVNGATGIRGYQAGIDSTSFAANIDVSWEADYAIFVELGTRYTSARAFARGAAVNWLGFLRNNANRFCNV